MRIPLRKFDRGIYVSQPEEGIPEGALTRGRGIDRDTPWLSRPGSTAIVSGDAHSITYFNDYYFYATGTAFLASTRGIAIQTGLTGNRLSFARMAPIAGRQDNLYVAGGGNLFKVEYSEIPLGGSSTETYLWNLSGFGTSEYYLTDTSGNQSTEVVNPVAVIENSTQTLTTGTLGSLATGEWNFGDNDTLGFNTIYVRLADSTTANPNDHDPFFLKSRTMRAFNAGITPPSHGPLASSGGSGDLTGTYTYRATYKNSRSLVRSNPSPAPSTEGEADGTASTLTLPPAYRLLLHFNGAAGATTATDAAGRGHIPNFVGTAALDTTETYFGSASLRLPNATGSFVEVPSHNDFVFEGKFTVDCRLKFNSLSTANWTGLFGAGKTGRFWHVLYHAGNNRLLFGRRVSLGYSNFYIYDQWNWTASTGVWYHLALINGFGDPAYSTYWAGELYAVDLTIDGSTISQVSPATYAPYHHTIWYTLTGGNEPLYIGTARGGSYYLPLDGWIDEFRVYEDAAWTESFTPSSGEYGGSTDTTSSVQYTAAGEKISLSNIPSSLDPQVDTVELWRTQANGTAFFKLTEIPDGETTYLDNTPDYQLGITELPTDNIIPYDWFDDLIGPHNGSMFWITRRFRGERGRLYYSAIGRAETMEGYIEVTSDDDPLQKLIYFQGQLAVFSESRFFQILGSNPYFVKEVTGVPGTIRPHSVVVTPYGITYEASDRTFRLLTGLQSQRFDDPIARVVAGEAAANLAAWGGGTTRTIATYARGEYIICDSTQTFCYNYEQRRIRELGLAPTAFYYNHETNQLLATVGSTLLEIEKQGKYDDNGTAISYELQTGSVLLSDDKKGIIQWVHIDTDTNDETLTVELIYDSESTLTLGTVTTTGDRKVTTFPANVHAQLAAVRLTGSLSSGPIALYGIDLDVYIPGEERQ